MRLLRSLLMAWMVAPMVATVAEPCVTQSQMQPAERDGLVRSAMTLASLTAANDADGVKAQTMPQFVTDFNGIASAIHGASPHLQGASFVPSTVWILDASGNTSTQDASFFCTLKGAPSQTSFTIPALPPGKYGLAVLDSVGTAEPWQVALLLRQSAPGTWQLGGLFPRATTAAGHDGLWYWNAARGYADKKQPWNAYVYYTEAEQLLKPVAFVTSSHLDKLYDERGKATPAALSAGLGEDKPLVIAGQKGEIRVTSLGAEPAPDKTAIDVVAHVKSEDALTDAVASRARNTAAAKAIVAAYPELRSAFHGVWVVQDLPGGQTYISEEPMTSL